MLLAAIDDKEMTRKRQEQYGVFTERSVRVGDQQEDLQRITHANWRSHMICNKPLYTLSALTLILGLAMIAPAQANRQPLITQKVINAALVTLDGNTRPEATTANDLGLVDDSMSLNGLQIVMPRSPENENFQHSKIPR
jgi:hypothetical protein